MALRRSYVLLLAAAFASTGASYRTTNFAVEAPTPQIAQQIGQAAEKYRQEKALEWLGREMPAWPEPCPLRVTVTMSGAGGATSFAFDRGRVLGQQMHIEGTLERLLASVLPHEVTHTVFAHHFRQPLPRWADEGGAVLSEDDIEKNRHDMLVRQILNTPNRAIPLRRLFALKEYPSDVMCLYAQGYSVANFLVSASSKPAFLNFVAQGMQQGWDSACQAHYRYQNVEELEQAWLAHLRATKRPPAQLAANTNSGAPANGTMVRTTAPPAQPNLDTAPSPVVRGQDQDADGAGAAVRPNFLPERYTPSGGRATRSVPAGPPGQWQPSPAPPPNVQLGQPLFMPPGPAPSPPSGFAPAGYPR